MAHNSINAGDTLHSAWGYDQTNASFFKVIARKGGWVTLKWLGTRNDWHGNMTGTAMPCELKDDPGVARDPEGAKSFRRKVRISGDFVECVKIEKWGMWAHVWSGKPVHVSCYA